MHIASRGLYGSPRVYRELLDQQVEVSEKTVAKLMAQAGLRARTCRKFRVQTTDSHHGHRVAEDLLEQHFVAELPNRVWCTDIAYILTD